MKLIQSRSVEVDLDKERARLKECLKGEQLARQLELVDLFEAGNTEEFAKKYWALPRDEEQEFPEQELVGNYEKLVWADGIGAEYDFTGVVKYGNWEITRN